MAIGSIINLGGGGGSLSGKGMIIVDTATMTVGDVIRVRDVYDSSNVQNKTVATVGTPLFFEVAPYCYYKICMVQTISDVETEIGGEYTTIDVGQTVYVNVLDKTTLGGIQGILNAHQETSLLNIGDEVNITVDGVLTPFLIGAINLYDTHEVIFVSKFITNKLTWGPWNAGYAGSNVKTYLETFYNNIIANEKVFIKSLNRSSLRPYSSTQDTYTEYVWINNRKEIDNTQSGVPVYPQIQLPIFTSVANRIRSYQGITNTWWTNDGVSASSTGVFAVDVDGSMFTHNDPNSGSRGVVPCFRLTADS